jgi:hypothetical protein
MRFTTFEFCLCFFIFLLSVNIMCLRWTLDDIRKDINELVKKQANVLDKYAWKDLL